LVYYSNRVPMISILHMVYERRCFRLYDVRIRIICIC